MDEYACLHGTKARISQLLNIREHMEKAIQYSPTDPTCYYLLGEWHYSCASVSWIERNMASMYIENLILFEAYNDLINIFQRYFLENCLKLVTR